MHNIFDYLDWRGDLSFTQDGFNEVDNLIFSVLAYLELDPLFPPTLEGVSFTIGEIGELCCQFQDKDPANEINPLFRDIPKLLCKVSQSNRFQGVKVSGYVNQVDFEKCNQFSALVFSLNENEHFLAFRGTDDTLAGWKEDFEMSFREEVKAQRDAVLYAKKIIATYPGSFYLGGHSKGGNLAVYAAANLEPEAQDRILAVYNNDGPGFLPHVLELEGYKRIVGRIKTFVPKSSIVGMLLEHGENYIAVNSNVFSLMQHNAFWWEVKGKSFVYEKGLTKGSRNFSKIIRLWLDQLSREQREEFVEVIFNLLQATGAMTVSELSQKKLALANDMLKSYKNLDPQAKEHLKKVLKIFFDKSQKVWLSSFEADVASLLARGSRKKVAEVPGYKYKKDST